MLNGLKHYAMPTETFAPEVVILANGNFPTHTLPLTLLKNAKLVVCCDGAVNEYVSRGFTPEIIVGDGDSITPENRERFASIIHYSPDTETNDLTKAVKYCIARQLKRIYIVGATGKREDHALGNISLLLDYMKVLDEVVMITDYGVFNPIEADATFEAYIGQQVSVVSLNAKPLKALGLKYPLSTFTNWWQGTLNEVEANPFTLFATDRTLVYRAF